MTRLCCSMVRLSQSIGVRGIPTDRVSPTIGVGQTERCEIRYLNADWAASVMASASSRTIILKAGNGLSQAKQKARDTAESKLHRSETTGQLTGAGVVPCGLNVGRGGGKRFDLVASVTSDKSS